MVTWNGINSDSWSVSEDGNTCTLTGSLTIPNGQTFSIYGNQNLVISQGGILTNNGAIWNHSTITCNGTIINNRSLHNVNATITNNGTVTNNKTIENRNGGIITNNGSLTNNSDGTVDNSNGTITNNGTVTNNNTISIILGGIINNSNGTITNNATITTNGTINNLGTIINNSAGTVFSYSTITNDGTITNLGTLSNHWTLTNNGTITSDGTITNTHWISNNSSGTITNNGGINNGLLSFSVPATITNRGTITNNNTISNINGGTIENYSGGRITNVETITNDGTIENKSGGAIANNGTITSDGSITNESGGTIENNSGGRIINDSTITDNATITNSGTITNDGVIINIGITVGIEPTQNEVKVVPWNTSAPSTYFLNLTNQQAANILTEFTQIHDDDAINLIMGGMDNAILRSMTESANDAERQAAVTANNAAILALMITADAAYILTATSITANAVGILAAMVPANTAEAASILVAMVSANTAEAASIMVAIVQNAKTAEAVAIMNAIAETSTQTAASILKAMEAPPGFTGNTAATTILNAMTAKDDVETQMREIGAALGDPYITPVYGPGYKLPDRNGVYRYISNKAPYANRFSIDADVVMLTKKQQFEALRTILEHAKDSVHSLSGKLVLDGYFFRNYMLTNCGEKLLIDMEADTINGKPLRNIKTEKFTVSIGKAQAPPVYPYTEEQETVYSLTIKTYHETYGNIEVVLHKYSNPQVRNGISMYTERKLTHENSKGFIMHFQHYKQFSIHKLGSKKDIANFDKAKVPRKRKQVTEEFLYPGTGTQNLRFLQQ